MFLNCLFKGKRMAIIRLQNECIYDWNLQGSKIVLKAIYYECKHLENVKFYPHKHFSVLMACLSSIN